jgi:hypothetical protein
MRTEGMPVLQSPFMDQELDVPEPNETIEPIAVELIVPVESRRFATPIVE